jgi:lipopolysaccharide export system protein LptA
VVRGYANSKLRWQVTAKTVWTGYNPFLFRGEAIGPGVVFDDDGQALINGIFAEQVQVNSQTKILYAYDSVSAYFLPRNTRLSLSSLVAADTQAPVKVTAGGLKYVESSRRTYLTDGVEIVQGSARIRPHVAADLDNVTNTVFIEDGFVMVVDDIVVSGNRMEILIDTSVSTIAGVTLLRTGRPTTNHALDPRERELRAETALLTADHMRFEQREEGYGIGVSGNVHARQGAKSFFGDSGTYDRETGALSLAGNVRVTLPDLRWLLLPERRKTMQNADMKKTVSLATTITCDRLEFDSEAQVLVLFGNVHVQQLDKEVRCSRLVYDDRSQKIRLSGNVRILKEGGDSLQAASVEVDLQEETYRATGQIQTEFKIRKAK